MVASLVQFALAAWLPLLRRIITPVVAGTALMLIAVMVMSIAIERIGELPEGVPPAAGPTVAATTLAVAVMLAMRASGVWRLWAPLIGIVSGCAVATGFSLYDPQPVLAAPWFDLPDFTAWPGIDLTPGVAFWTLLPAFLIVSLVSAVKASGDGVVIQQVSRRKPPATDFRLVQGVLNTNGLGALLSGIAGTLPTIILLPSTISLITFTRVAARRVGFAVGGVLVAVAAHGGRYLVRGGATEVIDGGWAPDRLVIIEFDSVDQARAWLSSADFLAIKDLRVSSASASVVIAEGM